MGEEIIRMNTTGITGDLAPNGPTDFQLEDAAWREAGRTQFEAAYSDDDSVYEQLNHDPAAT